MHRTSPAVLALAALAALPLAAQTRDDRAVRSAAATITQADVARRINIIAHDSMQGRDTPSRGLDLTAQYVADEFKRFGLRPAGEDGTWFQRYAISKRRIDAAGSHVGFMGNGVHAHAGLDKDARFMFGAVPAEEVHAPAFLLGGPLTAEALAGLDLHGKVALVVMDFSKPIPPGFNQLLGQFRDLGAEGVLVLSNRDSAQFAQRVRMQSQVRVAVGTSDGIPMVEAHERAFAEALPKFGLNLGEIRASTTPVARVVPGLTIGLGLKEEVLESATAPNTIGMIEGSDPKLKNEYVVFTAHMDHVGVAGPNGTGGCRAVGADSICNGADDDGSGTVGIIELAEAYSKLRVKPKRSVLFMTVSGEEKGLWGSDYFSNHPTVPLAQIVANVNMDMIGRNWPDTIVVIGKEHSDLGATLERVATAHPELRMAPIDDRWPEERFYFRSDHYNFARKGIPILFFFNGVHPDYHQVSDSPDKLNAEKEARILQLVFYLGLEVANAPNRPQWKPDSYKQIVEPAT
ncbi:MAG: M28 family peptidase [Gemmatimonadetes bacterium]|nr:M28 family peptidase [Gemmatimonadota bacterium]